MSKRRANVTHHEPGDSEPSSLHNSRDDLRAKFSQLSQTCTDRLRALGVDPQYDFIEADDPRMPQVIAAHEEYRRRFAELRALAVDSESADPIEELLNECQVERTIALQMRHLTESQVDWNAGITSLWRSMAAITAVQGGTRPVRPTVCGADQALDAIDLVVRWCEERRLAVTGKVVAGTEKISKEVTQTQKRTARGRRAKIERDLEWLAEFEAGDYPSVAAFAREREEESDTMRKALDRAREWKKRGG